jgi:pyroglutamyl-peptidase
MPSDEERFDRQEAKIPDITKNVGNLGVSNSDVIAISKSAMSKTILITSFATWKRNQPSNASDDLLEALLQTRSLPPSVYLLRHLPVNTPVAKDMAITQITQLQPQVMLCCGMAETRQKLSLESRAIVGFQTLRTPMRLPELMQDLIHSEISHDAGQFVCNSFYYTMMDYFKTHDLSCECLFIHVPILTNANRSQILIDFCKILNRCMF